VIRIGRRNDSSEGTNKPRPLKLIMHDTESKKTFMRNSSKLREQNNKNHTNISVTHDMTLTEREDNKKNCRKQKN
jgi:hypothetical protein